ncbi:MAG TPA: hypothetical protein VG227_00975 [Caulobacteraceae bacterium]|nr:hypothetical protein [Caulobacteraceae bacterium]
MRRNTGLSALLALSLVAPGAALAADNPACAAALDLILSHAGKGKHAEALVVAGAPDTQETKDYTADNIAQAPWSGEKPSLDLMGAFIGLPPASVLDSCPGLSDTLAKDHIQSGDDAVSRLTTTNGDIVDLPTYPATILSLSLPVVGGDGVHALVQQNLCEGVNMCAGSIRHLEREKSGHWRDVGDLPTSSS